MIKVKLRKLRDPRFVEGINRLCALTTLPVLRLWEVKEVADAIGKEEEKLQKVSLGLFEKYKEHIPEEKRQDGMITPEDLQGPTRAAFEKEAVELYEKTFEVPINEPIKIPGDTVGLSVTDLLALADIIAIERG